jgi:hypothetical protein
VSVEKHEVDSQMNLSSILQIQGFLTVQNFGLAWCLKLDFFLYVVALEPHIEKNVWSSVSLSMYGSVSLLVGFAQYVFQRT